MYLPQVGPSELLGWRAVDSVLAYCSHFDSHLHIFRTYSVEQPEFVIGQFIARFYAEPHGMLEQDAQ